MWCSLDSVLTLRWCRPFVLQSAAARNFHLNLFKWNNTMQITAILRHTLRKRCSGTHFNAAVNLAFSLSVCVFF